jgi:hypothetical protein
MCLLAKQDGYYTCPRVHDTVPSPSDFFRVAEAIRWTRGRGEMIIQRGPGIASFGFNSVECDKIGEV